MSHVHDDLPGRPTCDLPTKKACESRYADWSAMQQVILAYNIVQGGRWQAFRKEKSVLAQLVLVLAGEQGDIMTEGNASQAPWVLRLRAAIERVKAGDLPRYNLYTPDT